MAGIISSEFMVLDINSSIVEIINKEYLLLSFSFHGGYDHGRVIVIFNY